MALTDYFAGYASERFVEDKRKDLAIESMKDKYYRGWEENGLLALNFLEARQADDIYETLVGKRIKIESNKYKQELRTKNLEQIIKELDVNVDKEIKGKVIAKYGKVSYADAQQEMSQFSLDRQQAELDYKKTLSKIKPNEDKADEIVRNAQKELKKKLEELENKYDAVNLSNVNDAFRAVQDLYLKTYETELVLKKTYGSDKEENERMEKLAYAA